MLNASEGIEGDEAVGDGVGGGGAGSGGGDGDWGADGGWEDRGSDDDGAGAEDPAGGEVGGNARAQGSRRLNTAIPAIAAGTGSLKSSPGPDLENGCLSTGARSAAALQTTAPGKKDSNQLRRARKDANNSIGLKRGIAIRIATRIPKIGNQNLA